LDREPEGGTKSACLMEDVPGIGHKLTKPIIYYLRREFVSKNRIKTEKRQNFEKCVRLSQLLP
jgi:hypothetical protein